MPHAISNPNNSSAFGPLDEAMVIERAMQGGVEIPVSEDAGEKADDAIDFGDFSDSDLPDEEFDERSDEVEKDDSSEDVVDDLLALIDEATQNLDEEEDIGKAALNHDDGNLGKVVPNDDDDDDDNLGDVALDEDDDDLFGDAVLPRDNLDHLFDDPIIPRSNEAAAALVDPLAALPPKLLNVLSGDSLMPVPGKKDTKKLPGLENLINLSKPTFVPAEENSEEVNAQMLLFTMSKRKAERARKLAAGEELNPETDYLDAPEIDPDVFEKLWPEYKMDQTPRFVSLLAPRKAQYIRKAPARPPKPIQLSKPTLQLEPDQERLFLTTNLIGKKRRRDWDVENGYIFIAMPEVEEVCIDDEDQQIDALDENELIGNITMQQLRNVCQDWDSLDCLDVDDEDKTQTESHEIVKVLDGEYTSRVSAAKRHCIAYDSVSGATLPMFLHDIESWDEPEKLTARIASQIVLDLNDPLLLFDVQAPNANATANENAKPSGSSKPENKDASDNNVQKMLAKRFNFSNDEEYELLKENHSSKVRTTLANVALEHSLPATKLQYPFYKVSLDSAEARSFHRPSFGFPVTVIKFEQLARYKAKNMRASSMKTLYRSSSDLSMADNSSMLLVEYSEEYPMMLSNFGMANKLINYYRRTDDDDRLRPKKDIGETQVLLPQDKSPFSIFGFVEPGTITPTFHNAMYRSPIFKHEPKPTDFLCIRTSKGATAKWYLRNLDNLFVAGQQLPSMSVPGKKSRRATDAIKRRLRIIAFRIYKRNQMRRAKDPWLSNDMMKEHILEENTAKVRSKMKEFMKYDKHKSSWGPKPDEPVPTEEEMASWNRAEEICMLDAMQVGDQHLRDLGFNRDDINIGIDEDEKEGDTIDERLAPWRVTKDFLEACAGKAMLELHGEGDPTGRGEALSLLKTSMKGGFKAAGASVNDRLDARRMKDLNGHSYNVKAQDKSYADDILRIWKKQQHSLSSVVEHSDVEPDVDEEVEQDTREPGRTPPSQVATPSIRFNHRDDDTTSQMSRFSSNSQADNQLRIVRRVDGQSEPEVEVITDSKVIRAYIKRRTAIELKRLTLAEMKPTGKHVEDALKEKTLRAELQRLEHNKERRIARERAKGIVHSVDAAGTPGTPGDASTPTTTTRGGGTNRKCANCGQIGHIKTNKKACPLLNGSAKFEPNTFNSAAFATPAAVVDNAMSPDVL